MSTIEGVDIPRTLVEHFNADYAAGRYGGNIQEYTRVRYLAFRTEYAQMADKEPPSLLAWLKMISEVDEATAQREVKKQQSQ